MYSRLKTVSRMLISRSATQSLTTYIAVLLLSMLAAAGGVARPQKFQRSSGPVVMQCPTTASTAEGVHVAAGTNACQAPSNCSPALQVGRQVDHNITSQI